MIDFYRKSSIADVINQICMKLNGSKNLDPDYNTPIHYKKKIKSTNGFVKCNSKQV